VYDFLLTVAACVAYYVIVHPVIVAAFVVNCVVLFWHCRRMLHIMLLFGVLYCELYDFLLAVSACFDCYMIAPS
jgi:hypothetical protein